MKAARILLLCVMIVVLLSAACGCVPGDGKNSDANPAGFFTGIWHGWIAPISLIISLFNKNAGIYETFNTGFWYDLGYYMAIISGFGGLALSRRKKSCANHRDGS